jgi:hypothetical protein
LYQAERSLVPSASDRACISFHTLWNALLLLAAVVRSSDIVDFAKVVSFSDNPGVSSAAIESTKKNSFAPQMGQLLSLLTRKLQRLQNLTLYTDRSRMSPPLGDN